MQSEQKLRGLVVHGNSFQNFVFGISSVILFRSQCVHCVEAKLRHHGDVIMGAMASQITSLTIVYSTVSDQRKHQRSASLAFVWGIHRWPRNSPHKWPVTRKMFPFDDVIMLLSFSDLPRCLPPATQWTTWHEGPSSLRDRGLVRIQTLNASIPLAISHRHHGKQRHRGPFNPSINE